jgi:hypothetical protein
MARRANGMSHSTTLSKKRRCSPSRQLIGNEKKNVARKVIPAGIDNEYLELRCSCLFHPTTGIPCRHVRCILQRILPHHIYIRWHKGCFANYNRVGHERETECFKEKQNERRLLLVTEVEYREIMQAVQTKEEHWKLDLPASFFQSQPVTQADAKGLIPLEKEDMQESLYSSQDDSGLYSSGCLSQQVGLAAHKETEKPADDIARNPPMDINHCSDLLQTCKSVFSSCCNQAEQTEGVEAVMRKYMADMTREVQELVLQKKGSQNTTGVTFQPTCTLNVLGREAQVNRNGISDEK